jgi:hypothetical protein
MVSDSKAAPPQPKGADSISSALAVPAPLGSQLFMREGEKDFYQHWREQVDEQMLISFRYLNPNQKSKIG